MGRKPTGNPNGRPRKVINQKQFEGLCHIQCTIEEVCAVLDVDESTLERWCKEVYGTTFAKVFKQKRDMGKMSLRRHGFEMAKTNPSVHIFYAKNFLGMTDKVEQTVVEVEDLSSLVEMLRDDGNRNQPDLSDSDEEEGRPAGDQNE